MENLIYPTPGDLFENKSGVMFVYVGSKSLPILHSRKSMSFVKRDDFIWSELKKEWLLKVAVEQYHFFLSVLSAGDKKYVYTSKISFRFLNINRLVKVKKKFSGLKLSTFTESNRNLEGINSLENAVKNFQEYSYTGFGDLPLNIKDVIVPVKSLVFSPKMKNVSCGSCGVFYPATQKIFNFMQMYERLLETKQIKGLFVNKNASLVEFSIKHFTELKFEFTFKEICSDKSLTIEAQTLFDLRRWYSSIPFDSKAIDFICMAGNACPKDEMPWVLFDIDVEHCT